MDRPQKALDPCLDTGEVGEGPVVEPFVETLEAEEGEEVVAGGSSIRLLIRV